MSITTLQAADSGSASLTIINDNFDELEGDIATNTAKISFDSTSSTKLGTIEGSADVTDATNVTAAGALMDSEVTNLADVKAFDTTDYATSTQGGTADTALQPASTNTVTNKRIQPRLSSSASGNITPTKVDFDRYIRTAQAGAITISNPTMDIGEVTAIQLTDNSTARAITFGSQYMALDGLALPTTTTISKIMTMVLEKATATKVLVSYVEEA